MVVMESVQLKVNRDATLSDPCLRNKFCSYAIDVSKVPRGKSRWKTKLKGPSIGRLGFAA